MALTLEVSNALGQLADNLCQRLQTQGTGVFQPYTIVTQTEGMNNWLKQEIALHNGIAAHIDFTSPNELIHKIYFLLGGPFTETLQAENTRWLFYHVLGETEFIQHYPTVANYYYDEDHANADAAQKRFGLARKLADLFDQYQIYRPEMIQRWNEGQALETEQWQAWLWQRAKALSDDQLPDKTRIGSYISKALQDEALVRKLQERLPVVHLFGLSIFTAYHLGLLEEVAQKIDIHFHMLNPAPTVYWQDDKSEKVLAKWKQNNWDLATTFSEGNALLTSWGNIINESFKLFFNRDAFVNQYETIAVTEPPQDTLLHCLQNDLYHAAPKVQQPINDALLNDGSITINACYTRMREVECLYNYLVHLYHHQHAAIAPRDIVVMVNNMDDYAPYIRSVFGFAPYRFRFTIADESLVKGDHIFEALHSILALTEDLFTAENVLQLLDNAYVRERFGLKDLAKLRHLVEVANIRFGFEGDDATQTWSVSWMYGLQRILYGVCMSGANEWNTTPHNLFPIDAIEGLEALEAIRFIHFVEVLISSIKERATAKTLAEWADYTENITHQLVFNPDEEPDEGYRELLHHLTAYRHASTWMNEPISFEVFSQNLKQTLQSYTKSGLFISGGITFCSMIPMRSIPFTVVALLGMDYDRFPRKEKKLSFNLMELKREIGDRNVRDNDKHLFLETVLSATSFLYISYKGMDAKDNTALPPSALVDELLDYLETRIEKGDTLVRPALVTTQPLHGFSKKYEGNPRWYSYLKNTNTVTLQLIDHSKKQEPYNATNISLTELLRFFNNPIKAFYNKVYGIYYEENEAELPDTEIFKLDQLQAWHLKQQLFEVQDAATEAFQQEALSKGQLPLCNMADVAVQTMNAQVQQPKQVWESLVNGRTSHTATIELNTGDYTVSGTLDQVYEDELLLLVWSANITKYLVEARLQLLLGAASGTFQQIAILHAPSLQIYRAKAPSKEAALEEIHKLLHWYARGHESLLPYFDKLAADEKNLKLIDAGKIQDAVQALFEGYQATYDDPYVRNEYERGLFETAQASETFISLYQDVVETALELFTKLPS